MTLWDSQPWRRRGYSAGVTENLEHERTYAFPEPKIVADAGITMSGLEFLQATIRGEVPESPMMCTLGVRTVEAEPGRVVMQAPTEMFQFNTIGTGHGGFLATLLDTVMGSAVHSRLPAQQGFTTLDIQVRYRKAMKPDAGVVTVVGIAEHVGRTTGTASATVTNEDGAVLATATSTLLLLEKR